LVRPVDAAVFCCRNDLFLAGVILLGVPGTPVWSLGLIIGIDVVFGGSSLVAMAMQARRVPLWMTG